MKEISFNEHAKEILGNFRKGNFLITAAEGKVNVMTIGWGTMGIAWTIPVFIVLVRKSRFTHELLEKSGEFVITAPDEDMTEAINFCGTKSGRDMDKLAACGLKTLPGQKIITPVLQCRGTHYECKVIYRNDMEPAEFSLDDRINRRLYGDGDYHTIYFGEILCCYTT